MIWLPRSASPARRPQDIRAGARSRSARSDGRPRQTPSTCDRIIRDKRQGEGGARTRAARHPKAKHRLTLPHSRPRPPQQRSTAQERNSSPGSCRKAADRTVGVLGRSPRYLHRVGRGPDPLRRLHRLLPPEPPRLPKLAPPLPGPLPLEPPPDPPEPPPTTAGATGAATRATRCLRLAQPEQYRRGVDGRRAKAKPDQHSTTGQIGCLRRRTFPFTEQAHVPSSPSS